MSAHVVGKIEQLTNIADMIKKDHRTRVYLPYGYTPDVESDDLPKAPSGGSGESLEATMTEKNVRAMSDDELRAFINDYRKNILLELVAIMETEKRLHEIKFHGRQCSDETKEKLTKSVNRRWNKIAEFISLPNEE